MHCGARASHFILAYLALHPVDDPSTGAAVSALLRPLAVLFLGRYARHCNHIGWMHACVTWVSTGYFSPRAVGAHHRSTEFAVTRTRAPW